MLAVHNLSILREISLFHDLTDEQVSWLNNHLHRKTFSAGSNVITAGQPGEVVYVILGGTLKVDAAQVDGANVILALLGPGDIVGEMSLLDGGGRSANVVTLEESTLLWMDRSAFQECLRTMPAFTDNLIHILCARLRSASEHIQSLATLGIPGRVARQILVFVQRYGRITSNGDVLIPLRLTQSDLAGLVGASRVRVNQAIVHYKQRQYISVGEDHRIIVHNQEALARRCPSFAVLPSTLSVVGSMAVTNFTGHPLRM